MSKKKTCPKTVKKCCTTQ